jgi:hypothetical protein
MLTKTVTYDGTDYTLATITAKVGRRYVFGDAENKLPPGEINARLVAASLEAGGMENSMEFVESLPYFMGDAWALFIDAAMFVNGFKKATPPGKAEAEPSPAE